MQASEEGGEKKELAFSSSVNYNTTVKWIGVRDRDSLVSSQDNRRMIRKSHGDQMAT